MTHYMHHCYIACLTNAEWHMKDGTRIIIVCGSVLFHDGNMKLIIDLDW